MALRIKDLVIESGIIQSPMAACTDLAFRLIGRSKGMEFAFLEMVSANALVQRNGRTLELLKTVPADRPLGAQLVGCDADVMAEAAAMVESMGFDLLDLNLGCPVPKVTGGGDGAGSALLRQPEKAESIFKKVVAAVKKIPVTAKMRLGYDDPSGDEAADIARRAEAAGISAVAVHGRTRAQKYTGKADYRAIGKVKAAVKIPVIGNGDLHSAEDARRMREESGCDAVMVGRGGLGNPWIYTNIKDGLERPGAIPFIPDLVERRSTLMRHMELEVEHAGERSALVQMRRIGCWYFNGLPGAAEFRFRICRSSSISEVRDLIAGFSGVAALPTGFDESSRVLDVDVV